MDQNEALKVEHDKDLSDLSKMSKEIEEMEISLHESNYEDTLIWFSIIILMAALIFILFIVYKKRVNKKNDNNTTTEFDNFLYTGDSTKTSEQQDDD